MRTPRACHCSSLLRWLTAGSGLAAAVYGAYVGTAWFRYGRARPPAADEVDPLLDRFMPEYEVCDRHEIDVDTPADVTFAAAKALELDSSRIVRAIFRARIRLTPPDSCRSVADQIDGASGPVAPVVWARSSR